MWIVRLALRRPYTFVVMAILILAMGVLEIFRTPTDIFPNINIPVVSIIWSFNGLVPKDMNDRIISITERALTTTVDNIQHIESQSLNGIAVVKVFLQPTASVERGIAQITAVSQTQLRQLPPGTTPPPSRSRSCRLGPRAAGPSDSRRRGELTADRRRMFVLSVLGGGWRPSVAPLRLRSDLRNSSGHLAHEAMRHRVGAVGDAVLIRSALGDRHVVARAVAGKRQHDAPGRAGKVVDARTDNCGAAEGAGAHWPGDDASLPAVLAFVVALSSAAVAMLKRRRMAFA